MDYYKILEIDKNSTTQEIKKHYYKLAKKYHPDKNNGISDENFKLLSEAYSTLSNPKKRYLYDMKLLFKENLGEDFINHFSDIELEILHDYYLRLYTYFIKDTKYTLKQKKELTDCIAKCEHEFSKSYRSLVHIESMFIELIHLLAC